MLLTQTQRSPFVIRKSTTKLNSIEKQIGGLINKPRSYSLRKLTKQAQQNLFVRNLLHKNQQNQQQKIQIKNINKQEQIKISPNKKLLKNIQSNIKLSPIKQYQTKLKISSQSWLVFDYRKDSYKRGWRPADVGQFSGLLRILLFKVYLQLQKQNPHLKQFYLRVNTKYLKQQIQTAKQQRLSPSKRKGYIYRQPISRLLQNNIIINIIQLFYALLMTNYDDILQYAIVFIGYLCYCHILKINPLQQDSNHHYIQKVIEAIKYSQYLSQYLEQIFFPLFQMKSSQFDSQNYIFWSCANDICRLYLALQESQLFQQIIKCKQIQAKVKCQVGNRYWERKILKFVNKRVDMGQNYQFIGSWRGKKNYGVVCKNKQLNTLIVLENCKFGMTQCDIRNIQQWVRSLRKPIVDMRKTHAKLLPLLRVSESPPKFQKNLKRTMTQVQENNQVEKQQQQG